MGPTMESYEKIIEEALTAADTDTVVSMLAAALAGKVPYGGVQLSDPHGDSVSWPKAIPDCGCFRQRLTGDPLTGHVRDDGLMVEHYQSMAYGLLADTDRERCAILAGICERVLAKRQLPVEAPEAELVTA